MATSTIPDETVRSADPPAVPRTSSGRRRLASWKRTLLLVLPLALLLVLPQLLAQPDVTRFLLQRSLGSFADRIHYQRFELGWLQPVRVIGLQVTGEEPERQLARVAVVQTDRSLWHLLVSPSAPTAIELQEVELAYRGPGADPDWQAVFSQFQSDGDSDGPLPQLEVHVKDASVLIESSRSGRQVVFDQLTGIARLGQVESAEEMQLELKGQIQDQGTGRLEFRVEGGFKTAQTSLTRGDAEIDSSALELETLQPLLDLLDEETQLGGAFTGRARFTRETADELPRDLYQLDGNIRELQLTTPQFESGEQLQSAALIASASVEVQSDGIQFQHLELESDLGQLKVKGFLPAAGAAEVEAAKARIPQPFVLSGQADLALLSRMLPRTIGLRESVELVTATTSIDLERALGDSGNEYRAAIGIGTLEAVLDRRRIRWQEPLKVELLLAEQQAGWSIRQFDCRSDFAELSATGDFQAASFDFRCDLDQAHQVVEQFFDWPSFQMAGIVSGRGATRTVEAGTRRLLVEARLQKLLLSMGDSFAIRSNEGRVMLAADMDAEVRTIRTARLQFEESESDVVLLTLLEPVQRDTTEQSVTVDMKATGALSEWAARLGLGSLSQRITRGRFDLATRLDWNGQTLTAGIERLNIANLRLDDGERFFEQRDVRGTGKLRWLASTGTLRIPELVLSGESVSADVRDFELRTEDQAYDGQLSLRGRLEDAVVWSGLQQPARCLGAFGAQLDCRSNSGVTRLDGQLRCERLLVDSGASQVDELRDLGPVTCKFQGSLSAGGRALQMDEAQVTSSWLTLAASGSITDLQRSCHAALTGQVGYDWESLMLLAGIERKHFELTGKRNERFHVNGPLTALSAAGGATGDGAVLQIESSVGWQSGTVLAMPLGGLETRAVVLNQQATVDPLRVSIGTGQLQLNPILVWSTGEPLFAIRDQLRLSSLKLSPENCEAWLQFVAPVLARSTRVEGELGLTMSQLVVPLQRPSLTRARGVVEVAQATLQPGPVLQSVETILRQVESILRRREAAAGAAQQDWVRLPQQQIEFVMRDGRVHHRGLVLQSGDLQIHSSGSVGVDESLNLTLEIVIREEWVRSQRHLARLAGRRLQIPITGTLSRPVPDPRVVQSLLQQIGQGAVESAIEGELDKQLNRLFDRIGR